MIATKTKNDKNNAKSWNNFSQLVLLEEEKKKAARYLLTRASRRTSHILFDPGTKKSIGGETESGAKCQNAWRYSSILYNPRAQRLSTGQEYRRAIPSSRRKRHGVWLKARAVRSSNTRMSSNQQALRNASQSNLTKLSDQSAVPLQPSKDRLDQSALILHLFALVRTNRHKVNIMCWYMDIDEERCIVYIYGHTTPYSPEEKGCPV